MIARVKTLIVDTIKANGQGEITGDILQDVLLEMLTTFGEAVNEGGADSHWHDNKAVLDLFRFDNEGNVYIDRTFYSHQGISAFGLGDDGGGGGGDFDRLDKWVDYDSTKAGWVLSALLGKDLDTRVGANSSSILDLNQRVEAIDEVASDKNFVHTQGLASDVWEITHDLNKYPSVTIIDSGGTEVIGNINYIDTSTVSITFSSEFSGKAILN